MSTTTQSYIDDSPLPPLHHTNPHHPFPQPNPSPPPSHHDDTPPFLPSLRPPTTTAPPPRAPKPWSPAIAAAVGGDARRSVARMRGLAWRSWVGCGGEVSKEGEGVVKGVLGEGKGNVREDVVRVCGPVRWGSLEFVIRGEEGRVVVVGREGGFDSAAGEVEILRERDDEGMKSNGKRKYGSHTQLGLSKEVLRHQIPDTSPPPSSTEDTTRHRQSSPDLCMTGAQTGWPSRTASPLVSHASTWGTPPPHAARARHRHRYESGSAVSSRWTSPARSPVEFGRSADLESDGAWARPRTHRTGATKHGDFKRREALYPHNAHTDFVEVLYDSPPGETPHSQPSSELGWGSPAQPSRAWGSVASDAWEGEDAQDGSWDGFERRRTSSEVGAAGESVRSWAGVGGGSGRGGSEDGDREGLGGRGWLSAG